MCRHLAYVGPPITLASLLYDPPHSLVRQSWAPRQQRHGTINVDGYGVGWYQPEVRPEPARFRRAGPIWADRSLESLAQVVRSGAFLAAVRSATPPAPSEETGAAPFTDGKWLFSLNGVVTGDLVALRQQVSPRRQAHIAGVSDTEVLFALLLDAVDGSDRPEGALARVIGHVPGRLNMLLTDGATIWATTQGETLYWRYHPRATTLDARTLGTGSPSPGPMGTGSLGTGSLGTGSPGDGPMGTGSLGRGVIVASEPLDDEPGWVAVPDGSRLVATPAGGSFAPLTLSQGALAP